MFIKASAIKHENVQHTVSLSFTPYLYIHTHEEKNDKDEAKSIQQNNKYTTNKIQEDYYSLQPVLTACCTANNYIEKQRLSEFYRLFPTSISVIRA